MRWLRSNAAPDRLQHFGRGLRGDDSFAYSFGFVFNSFGCERQLPLLCCQRQLQSGNLKRSYLIQNYL